MDIYVQVSLIFIISVFFLVFNHDLIIDVYTFILPAYGASQLQIQQLMTSQIRSYLI